MSNEVPVNRKISTGDAKKLSDNFAKLPSQNIKAANKKKASPAAVKFLENVNKSMIDFCCFDDKLNLISPDGKSLGEYKASVETTKLNNREVVLIRASIQGKINDIPIGNCLTAYLDSKDLSILDQEYRQCIKIKGKTIEKFTTIKRDDAGQLTVNKTVTQQHTATKSQFKIKKHAQEGFVTEASNILIQRLLIISNCQIEDMVFSSLDTDAKCLVPMSYTLLPDVKQQFGSEFIPVLGLERHLQEDLPSVWHSFFTSDGIMTYRVQQGCPGILHRSYVPFPAIAPEPKPVFKNRLSLDFEQDAELNSKFTAKKNTLKQDHENYLHHSDIKRILSDFLQFVLLHKPDNVVGFAASYFTSFASSFNEDNAGSLSQALPDIHKDLDLNPVFAN